jgi:hypothetical protein
MRIEADYGYHEFRPPKCRLQPVGIFSQQVGLRMTLFSILTATGWSQLHFEPVLHIFRTDNPVGDVANDTFFFSGIHRSKQENTTAIADDFHILGML